MNGFKNATQKTRKAWTIANELLLADKQKRECKSI